MEADRVWNTALFDRQGWWLSDTLAEGRIRAQVLARSSPGVKLSVPRREETASLLVVRNTRARTYDLAVGQVDQIWQFRQNSIHSTIRCRPRDARRERINCPFIVLWDHKKGLPEKLTMVWLGNRGDVALIEDELLTSLVSRGALVPSDVPLRRSW